MLRLTFLTITLFALSEHAYSQSHDSAAIYLSKGQQLEEGGYLHKALDAYTRSNEARGASAHAKAAALSGMASILSSSGQYDSVTTYLLRSRSLDPSPANLVVNYQAEAKYWQSQNKYDQAIASLELAKENAEKINDKKNLAIILSSLGSIYFSHQPDKSVARNYLLESNKLCDSIYHYNIIARNYGRLANVAMNLNDGATAKKYLDKAYRIVELSDNLSVRAYIISSLAILASGENRIDESLKYLEEAIRIKRELGQLRSLQNDLLNISEAYMQIKEYGKAERALTEGGDISRSLKDLVYMKYFYERASMLDSLRGDYKGAFRNYRLAMKYKDSTFSAKHLRDVRDIQEKYESAQKEKIIAERELEIDRQRFVLALVIIAVVISIIILSVIMIVRRSKFRKEQHFTRLQTIVNTQEEVRQRIARDLHDGLVQVLGAAKMSLQSIGPDADKAILQKQIRNASDIIDEAVTEARSISHEALPYSLLKDGLVPALEELFARSLASFKFNYDSTMSFDEHISINIFRIAQELVNNFQKHVKDGHVDISLKMHDKNVHFIFSDNGPGFDTTNASKGAGLSNMTTRAELMNGQLVVESAPGKGTSTHLTIPL